MALSIQYSGAPKSAFRLSVPDQGLSIDSQTALIGPSGAGKSTFVKALAGPWNQLVFSREGIPRTPRLDHAKTGSWLQRLFVTAIPPEAVALREQFAGSGGVFAVHQEPSDCFLPWRSLLRHQKLIRKLKDADHAEEFEANIVGLGIDFCRYRDSLPGNLSGGQQRRLALAIMLSFRPSLLVIDEALGSLDVQTVELVMEHVASLVAIRKFRVLLVSHDLYTLSAHTNSALVASGGSIGMIHRGSGTDPEWLAQLRREFL